MSHRFISLLWLLLVFDGFSCGPLFCHITFIIENLISSFVSIGNVPRKEERNKCARIIHVHVWKQWVPLQLAIFCGGGYDDDDDGISFMLLVSFSPLLTDGIISKSGIRHSTFKMNIILFQQWAAILFSWFLFGCCCHCNGINKTLPWQCVLFTRLHPFFHEFMQYWRSLWYLCGITLSSWNSTTFIFGWCWVVQYQVERGRAISMAIE